MRAEMLALHMKIELLRKAMVQRAEKHGCTHPLVLAYSKKLDKEHVRFERLRKAV